VLRVTRYALRVTCYVVLRVTCCYVLCVTCYDYCTTVVSDATACEPRSSSLFLTLPHSSSLFLTLPHSSPPPFALSPVSWLQSDAVAAVLANEEATARGLASLLQNHGAEVEWKVCALWEAALGLLPLDPSSVALPDLGTAAPTPNPPPFSCFYTWYAVGTPYTSSPRNF